VLLSGEVGEAGAGLLTERIGAHVSRVCALLIVLGLPLAGCAQMNAQRAANNPQHAYHVARIAEGAYLASGHVQRSVLERLSQLDHDAREALARWQEQPDPANAQAASVLVAQLSDYLVNEARF
jgi:hypothetical protein